MGDSEENLLLLLPVEIFTHVVSFVDPKSYNTLKIMSYDTYETLSEPSFKEQYLSSHELLPEQWKGDLDTYFKRMYSLGWKLHSFQLKTEETRSAAIRLIVEIDDLGGFLFFQNENLPINWRVVHTTIPLSRGTRIFSEILYQELPLDVNYVLEASINHLNYSLLRCAEEEGIKIDWDYVKTRIEKIFGRRSIADYD